jgi:outer membrane protein
VERRVVFEAARRSALAASAAFGTVALVQGAAFAQSPAPRAGAGQPTVDTTPVTPSTPATQASGPMPDKTTPSGRVLSLAAAEKAALEAQPLLRAARAQTASAEAAADAARSPLLPQVVGSATYSHDWGAFRTSTSIGGTPTTTGSTGSSPLSNQFNIWSFGLTATQLIYDFGQTTERYGAAKDTAEAQLFEERVTRLQILANVRQAYFNARANKDLVDVAQETLDDQQKHLKQVEAFVQVGTQPEIALAQQKAAVATARVQLISAQNSYDTSKAQLNQAAGLVGGTEYDVVDEEEAHIDDEDEPLETLVQKALAARPELANLFKQQDAQQATIRSAKGAYGPTLAASGGASEAGLTLDTLTPNINVGVSLTWPLFQGGLTKATVRQAEANLSNIDAQRDLVALQIQLGVNTAQLAVRAAKATIGASNDALVSAAEQLRLAEQRYATNVGSIIELDDAQVAYTSAAAQVVIARYSLATARALLLAALGRT